MAPEWHPTYLDVVFPLHNLVPNFVPLKLSEFSILILIQSAGFDEARGVFLISTLTMDPPPK